MITLIFDGLASLFVDLTVKDEEAKKAAKAAVHGAFAGVGLAMGDVSGAVDATVAGVRAGGEVAKLTTHDQEALGIIDSVVSLAGGAAGTAVDGGANALKGYFVATGAGALVGAAAGGGEGFKVGLSLGSGFGGDVSNVLEGAIEPLAWKAGGAVVGGSIAAGAADPDDRLQAFQLGAQLGMKLGGATGGDDAEEIGHGLADVGLTLGAGAALKAARGKDGRSTLEAMQLVHGLTSQVEQTFHAATSDSRAEAAKHDSKAKAAKAEAQGADGPQSEAETEEAPEKMGSKDWAKLVLDDAKEIASIIADETTGKKAREAQREAEIWGDSLHADLARAAGQTHQVVSRVLATEGDVSVALDLGARVERKEQREAKAKAKADAQAKVDAMEAQKRETRELNRIHLEGTKPSIA